MPGFVGATTRADPEASMTTLLLPGLGGSGPGHWQALWQEVSPEARPVEQENWNAPDLESWLERVAAEVDRAPGAILVGHSLACALVAHLAERRRDLLIGGALLVAPADVDDRTRTPASVASFAPMPLERLPFPSIVVGSSNDPFVSIGRAMLFAYAWGSRFVHLRDSGHINVASGFGPWPDGYRLARQLQDKRERRPDLRVIEGARYPHITGALSSWLR
jgi:predicted alpha/beta hydrolase family esterase